MKENYVTSKEIIAKVYRDTGFSEELPWIDLITWIDEALRLISHPMQFVRRIAGDKSHPPLDITDFKAKLPCNIYQIEQIAVNGQPAYRSTDTFHHLISDKCCTVGQRTFQEDLFEDSFRNVTIDGNVITGPNVFTNNPVSGNGPTTYMPITYDINDDFITLSVKEGKVCIAYLQYPLDDEGFPLIPDLQEYKEFVAAYLIFKFLKRGWYVGTHDERMYRDAEKDYMWKAGAASSRIKMPDVDKMQSIMNQVVKLKPNMNAYEHFFVDLGLRERKTIQR